jgi:hypothetical protein
VIEREREREREKELTKCTEILYKIGNSTNGRVKAWAWGRAWRRA